MPPETRGSIVLLSLLVSRYVRVCGLVGLQYLVQKLHGTPDWEARNNAGQSPLDLARAAKCVAVAHILDRVRFAAIHRIDRERETEGCHATGRLREHPWTYFLQFDGKRVRTEEDDDDEAEELDDESQADGSYEPHDLAAMVLHGYVGVAALDAHNYRTSACLRVLCLCLLCLSLAQRHGSCLSLSLSVCMHVCASFVCLAVQHGATASRRRHGL